MGDAVIAEFLIAAVVLLAGFVAVWDIERKKIAATRFNAATFDRLDAIDKEHERIVEQQKRILEKLTSVGSGVVSRLPRSGRA